jgi:hypothetical protein
MAGYIRRFLVDPGEAVLLEIESINILDLDPPASISGVGTGTALLVGEFENGPFGATAGVLDAQGNSQKGTYEVGSATEMAALYGNFGYTYDGVPSNNVCARKRNADTAVIPEYFNGNGMIQLNGKKFRRLLINRVDTSVGAVEFRRLAYAKGNAAFKFDLEPTEHLDFKVDAGGPFVATFTATAGTVTGAAAAFGTIVSGDTVILGYDLAPDFTVVFLAGDTTVAAVIARINTYAGFTFATNAAGQVKLDGRQRGSGGQVRVVAGGTATAKCGLVVAVTAGTGNVANIDAVTSTELNTIVVAASANANVVLGSDGKLRLTNITTSLTGTIEVLAASSANVLTQLGFAVGVYTAVTGNAGTIPAGTRVRVAAGQQFVTMQDVNVTAALAGPYSVKIRHALDDGTGLLANAGTVTVVEQAPDVDSFAVINPLPTTAALTETQLDVAYLAAIDSTFDLNSVAREANLVWSARQSNAVRRKLKDNAIQASAGGCFGRVACVRPPLGVTKATARSTTTEPGVGGYRDQRVIYNYPGVRMFVPPIALRGTAGGVGFTADGFIDGGSDGFCISVMSQLAPEEDPGQLTEFTGAIVSLESSANAQNFSITDYTNLKGSGICAPRMDEGTAIFQSGVTSVDPTVFPNLIDINRRRMADFIQDTLARRFKGFSKKLSTRKRRNAVVSEITSFMLSLMGNVQTGDGQRIAGYVIDQKSGNTDTSLGKGLFRVILRVRTLSSLKSIVLATTIGPNVDISVAEAA